MRLSSSLPQGNASMFSSLKADLVDQRKTNILLLLRRQAEEVISLLSTRWTGLSLPSEAACPATRFRRQCQPLRDEGPTPTAATASETTTT